MILYIKAIDCAEGFNCSNNIINSFCEGIKCILRKPNYQMYILSNEELTTPKLGSLLMPLVSDVDNSSIETEQKLHYKFILLFLINNIIKIIICSIY